jgi:glutaminyl-peptide cyclotransferase
MASANQQVIGTAFENMARRPRVAALDFAPFSRAPFSRAPFSRASFSSALRKAGALFLFSAVALSCAVLAGILFFGRGDSSENAAPATSNLRLEDIPFNGARAYDYLKQLCAIGPRPSGSLGMQTQQKLLSEHFKRLGGRVEFQRFRTPHPVNNSPVEMANMIVHWHAEKSERILLCAHYDTLPYALEDKENPRGVFVGANDNAGGVALLMELAHDLPGIEGRYGVDFLLLDGEEFMFTPKGRFFLGSEYFARQYVDKPPKYRYRWGVLLDMISDKDLQVYQEQNSWLWDDTRPLVKALWATAARLGVREFIARPKHYVEDDHFMLHNIGKIPCIDVIDFDYPPWHTRADTPENCSALSLAKVGWVLSEWLRSAK